MDTQAKARELMAKKRQHEHQDEENLLSLTEQKIQEHHSENVDEKARDLAAENRLHEDNIEDNMLSRSEEQLEKHK